MNLGMKAANALDICIYCECHKSRWHMCTMDSGCKPRYYTNGDGKLVLPSLVQGKPGFAREPLLKSDAYEFVMIDILHLYLRISDQILVAACGLMGEKGRELFAEFCVENGANRFKLRQTDKDDASKIKISSLTGPNRRKILPALSVIKLRSFLPVDDANCVFSVLSLFLEIMAAFDKPEVDVYKLTKDVKRFVALFCVLKNDTLIPDYVHLLLHVPFLVSQFGNIKRFEQQAVERNNKFVEKKYFSQSKCDVKQALKAANRAFLY